jgi:hypothetical protein
MEFNQNFGDWHLLLNFLSLSYCCGEVFFCNEDFIEEVLVIILEGNKMFVKLFIFWSIAGSDFLI